MMEMSNEDVLMQHMIACAPEREDEIRTLWSEYHPEVILVENAKQVTLEACKDWIKFDAKTMDIFWLVGFCGWRAIECYSPHVIGAVASGAKVSEIIQQDAEIGPIERDYKERLSALQKLISVADSDAAPWPPDIPRPSADRDALDDPQYKAAFDLTCLAVAFTLFHEFRHVMLDQDDQRPAQRNEEELACDVWAREFMTVKLAAYAQTHSLNYHEVLRVRSMGFALAALILHEITPVWEHGGGGQYFSIATRLQTIIENTSLPNSDHFWVQAASLLIGIFRQKGLSLDISAGSAKALTYQLLTQL